MTTELANDLLTYATFAFVFWMLGRLIRSEYRRRREDKRSQDEWDSIQRQIREARTAEERTAATERFVERLKRVS